MNNSTIKNDSAIVDSVATSGLQQSPSAKDARLAEFKALAYEFDSKLAAMTAEEEGMLAARAARTLNLQQSQLAREIHMTKLQEMHENLYRARDAYKLERAKEAVRSLDSFSLFLSLPFFPFHF